jgi:hypothetical protein
MCDSEVRECIYLYATHQPASQHSLLSLSVWLFLILYIFNENSSSANKQEVSSSLDIHRLVQAAFDETQQRSLLSLA